MTSVSATALPGLPANLRAVRAVRAVHDVHDVRLWRERIHQAQQGVG
jgi:hypothetical protein